MSGLHNGGTVFGITIEEERLELSRHHRFLLVKSRIAGFNYLTDRIVTSCVDLQELLMYLRSNVSTYWAKRLIGRLTGIILVRLKMYHENPKWYGYRGELMMSASWIICVQYLQRVTKVLQIRHGFPSKYRRFDIDTKRLHQLSGQWYDATYEVANKMVIHHAKLKAKEAL